MKYGDKVFITRKYWRITDNSNKRKWVAHRFVHDGLYLGTRTLQNGHFIIKYTTWEGNKFKADEYILCALVSPGSQHNPVYVPLDSIEKVEVKQ